jgi:hypothetical protein
MALLAAWSPTPRAAHRPEGRDEPGARLAVIAPKIADEAIRFLASILFFFSAARQSWRTDQRWSLAGLL